MESLRAFLRSLGKHRTFGPFVRLEAKAAALSPSDWLVVSALGAIMGLAAFAMLASVSTALTVEVPAHGGTYIEGVEGTPRFINPLLAISDTDRDLTALVFSGLLKANPDGSFAPDIAASYTESDDKRTYTFTLRSDAQFQDGTPVTADDVVFTVNAAQNPEMKSPRRPNWEGVEVAATDPHTVTFTLKAPYAPFLENMTLGILPSHIWKGVTAEEFPFNNFNTHPIGSGPFSVESVKQNGSGIPTEYHLRAFGNAIRPPFIDRFILKFYANTGALTDALNRGDVEAAHSLNPTNVNVSTVVNEAVFTRVFGVFFNQNQNALFADAALRGALSQAVDKEEIVSIVVSGYGSPIGGPLPPEGVASTTGDSLSKEGRIASARDTLTRAGWKLGTDGIFTKTVKKQTTRLAFSLATSNTPELKRAAELVAADWKSLGADVELKFFEQNDLNQEVIRPRKYDALLFGLVVGREPDLFAFWHSSQRIDPGLNIGLYANSDVDKKLEQARAESDPTRRRADTKSAADLIAKETAAVFLYAPHFVYLTPGSVHGIVLPSIETPSDRYMNVDEWYVKTERVWPFLTKNIFALFSI